MDCKIGDAFSKNPHAGEKVAAVLLVPASTLKNGTISINMCGTGVRIVRVNVTITRVLKALSKLTARGKTCDRVNYKCCTAAS
jgi:hypothetical protein